MEHAYLIMAHRNWGQLRKLIELLDDGRNDIYLLIDRKSRISDCKKKEFESALRHARLNYVRSKRINWGGYSMVNAELTLLKTALRGHYTYYHLLSGMDLPLKTQDEIHAFFQQHREKEFITFAKEGEWIDRIKERYQYYWLFSERSNRKSRPKWRRLNRRFINLQKRIGINRLRNREFAAGSQWFSITDDFARYICDKKRVIRGRYRYTFIPDESFIQTMAEESGFRSRIYEDPLSREYLSNTRYTDWTRGNPHTWRQEELEELTESGCMFARKFDEKVDNEIITSIYEILKPKQ